jgi:transposase
MRAPIISGVARANLRAEMQQAYEVDGLTIEQVAERFGRSYGTTHKLLTEANTEIRPRGGFRGR